MTERLRLRRWQDSDLAPFAALNADAEVMREFPAPLTRAQSDALAKGADEHLVEHGWGLWAVEVAAAGPTGEGRFAGFTGLAVPSFEEHFTPAVEVGWRLARWAWGHGYATEAATAALDVAFSTLGRPEVVSFTTVTNHRSQAVMRRLGMTHDPAEDFDHPSLPVGHPLQRHVLYRLRAPLAARPVPVAATRALRQAVLRPHSSLEQLAAHEPADAHAAGVWAGSELVAAGLIGREGDPGDWRVRGMATAPAARGRGAGAAVLRALVAHARAGGAVRVWCNARTPACSFYERGGFRVVSEPFELPEIGPHVRMELFSGEAQGTLSSCF